MLMFTSKKPVLLISLSASLALLPACSPDGISQSVRVDAPDQSSNSNNSTDNSQNNTGSGSQTNVSNSGSGNQAVNTGSGSQSLNTGSGTQNTNTGSGIQNNTSTVVNNTTNNTVAGNQTNVGGDQINQTDNSTTNNTTNNNTVNQDNSTTNNTTSNTTNNVDNSVTQNFNVTNVAVNINVNQTTERQQEDPGSPIETEKVIEEVTNAEVRIDSIDNVQEYRLYAANERISTSTSPVFTIAPEFYTLFLTADLSVRVVINGTERPSQNTFKALTNISLTGTVYDDTGAPQSNVDIVVQSVNQSRDFFETTRTNSNGQYTIDNVPTGLLMRIEASKGGFASRYQLQTLQPAQNANISFSGLNAINPKPEVIGVSPGRNAAGVDPRTSFVLRFSEPMDRQSVENAFRIRAYSSESLSVGGNLTGSGSLDSTSGSQIWDRDAFNISWNASNTEVVFTFANERMLPTDKNSANAPDYQVLLEGEIRDASGMGRNSQPFNLTDGPFENSYKFSVRTDTTAPTVTSITAQTAENGGMNGDAILVRFSERMIHYTRGLSIAGGMNGSAAQAPAAYPGAGNATADNTACNYTVRVQRAGEEVLNQTWCSLGGSAFYDANDPTHKTVLLRPPSGEDIYTIGDVVTVTVANTVLDPAGNNMGSYNSASANAN